ncbi:Bcr/CflA family drug resistance efflux transporter [Nitratireductor aestuarii]|uniref:Bcr/CflA family efflux transporter n=1 Tax=Nitratireductor aestuarii TaxID=1735103 RepID=A0A916RFH6_9HYPH|nr:multidrug effflux MFS transporter [Nitratireductor aestuarii]GGA52260.1 Bcr/CflA family drug resistance efflux transporter [Nitratireductor aestuarii]
MDKSIVKEPQPGSASSIGAQPSYDPASLIGKKEFVALAAAIMSINALGIDVVLPALQQMGSALNVDDENSRQLVITAYVMGLGLGQIFYGPFADRFGRRGPLFFGLGIFIIGSIISAFVPSFALMLVLRALQGFGAASTRVIAVSAVRDMYGGRRMAEVMSIIMMIFMVVPIFAPTLGRIFMSLGGWPMIYVLTATVTAGIAVWAWIRLPETLAPENRRSIAVSSILQGFRIVITNRLAACYMLATTAIMGALFGFINSAQQIYIDIYDMEDVFTYMFALGGSLMAISSYSNSRLVGRVGMRRLSHGALIGFIGISGIWLIITLLGPVPFWLFFLLFSLAMFQFGWVAGNFNAIAMEPLGHVAGTAASVQGFVSTIGSGLFGALIGISFDGSLTPIAAGYFILGLLSLVLVLIAERGKLFQQISPAVKH